ncbi:MAG: competence/damage-inducible protein A, partial [Saprospiraceae bacterium]|nr:competence/damage-inducible protein A [Saprospiraceae bacterium]
MKVHLLTIGDELLIGQVVDTNSAWMGRQLNLAGIQVAGIVSAPDEHDDIVDAIGHCLQRSQVVIMTGGLGPTKDDVTKKAIAEYYGVGFVFSQETYERLVRIFQRLGRPVTEALRQQCFMPQNAELLLNHMGTAPGMWMEENGRVLISLPGVPYEMKHLMETAVIPRLLERFPVAPRKHRTVLTAGEGESTIADRLEKFEDELPADLRLAYLPSL